MYVQMDLKYLPFGYVNPATAAVSEELDYLLPYIEQR